jgi:hypothetical protein
MDGALIGIDVPNQGLEFVFEILHLIFHREQNQAQGAGQQDKQHGRMPDHAALLLP